MIPAGLQMVNTFVGCGSNMAETKPLCFTLVFVMTSACSISEYRTIIKFDARFDPNVMLPNMLWMQRNSAPGANNCPL